MPDLAMGPTISISGRLLDIQAGGLTPAPIVGGTVCVYPAGAPCVTTDDAGVYALDGVPQNVDTAIQLRAAGFVTDTFPFNLEFALSGFGVAMTPDAHFTTYQATAQKTQDPTKGTLLVTLIPEGGVKTNGSTLALVPPAGDGPYYYDAPNPSAMLGTSSGNGFTFFYNVPVGDVELSITPPAGFTCHPYAAWVSGTRFKAPSIAGSITSVAISCG